MMVADGSVQAVAVAPHPSAAAWFDNTTLPLTPLIDRFPVMISGVTGKAAPALPAALHWMSRYEPGNIVVPAGNAYTLEAVEPKLPVAEPYWMEKPVNDCVVPLTLCNST